MKCHLTAPMRRPELSRVDVATHLLNILRPQPFTRLPTALLVGSWDEHGACWCSPVPDGQSTAPGGCCNPFDKLGAASRKERGTSRRKEPRRRIQRSITPAQQIETVVRLSPRDVSGTSLLVTQQNRGNLAYDCFYLYRLLQMLNISTLEKPRSLSVACRLFIQETMVRGSDRPIDERGFVE